MSDQFEDLKRLAEMREKGEITDAEYEKIKADLISEMDSAQPQATTQPHATTSNSSEQTHDPIENQTRWWLIGTGVLMAVGSLLPWAQAGIFSAAGTDGDGIFTLIGGVIVAIVGIADRNSMVTGIGTVLIAGFSLWIVINIFSGLGDLDFGSAGSGLILTGLASLFAIIAGFKVISASRNS